MKVLFLVQSCNEERYIKEEDIIRNTWGSRIWKNCDLYFYRGGGEDILEGDVLSLKCGDKLEDTFIKTIRALKVFKNKYDFIIRTNTSTWINTEVLLNTLKTIDINEHNLIGGNIVSNTGSQGIPFLRGNFLILNKTVQNDLFESIEGKVYTGVDDVCIGLNLFRYYNKMKIDYLKALNCLKQDKYTEDYSFKQLDNVISVWCAEYIKDKKDSSILNKIDEEYLKRKQLKLIKDKEIETVLGNMKIG